MTGLFASGGESQAMSKAERTYWEMSFGSYSSTSLIRGWCQID